MRLKAKTSSSLGLLLANSLLLPLLLVAASVGEVQRAEVAPVAPTTSQNNKTLSRHKDKQAGRSQERCEYEKGPWMACDASTGIQQRELKLKQKQRKRQQQQQDQLVLGKNRCDPVKSIRRQCKTGCKYVRGEWSSDCKDGLRVRVDRLVGRVGVAAAAAANASKENECQLERRVTKDCRRACHYIKSAWSECANGFKTRNLTLDNSPFVASFINSATVTKIGPSKESNCVKQKQLRRECRERKTTNEKRKLPKQILAQRRKLKQGEQRNGQQQVTAPASSLTTTTTTSSSPSSALPSR